MSSQVLRRGAIAAVGARTPPVTPPLTNMRSWWKADAISSPPADGGLLQNWTDSSGNGRTASQATSGNRPTYRTTGAFLPNNKPCVEFTRATPTWLTATTPNNGATTRFVVFRLKTAALTQNLVTSDSGFDLYLDTGNNVMADIPNIASLNVFPAPQVAAAGSWQIAMFDSNGSNSHHSFLNSLTGGTSTVAAAATATTMSIGARGWSAGADALDGYIAEIIDYGVVQSATVRNQILTYLIGKYTPGPGNPTGAERDFDWDVSETQAFTHSLSNWECGSAHQHAWITNRTRLGTGHAERFEMHNNVATDTYGNMRSLMAIVDTNDGGTSQGSIVGYDDVYWCFSSYFPTSGAGDADATVVPTFSQTTVPDYQHLWEMHERSQLLNSGAHPISEVANHAVMIRSNQLQFRSRCGTWNWTGASWTAPIWATTTPSTSGSNDQIPIPIVKPGSTNATFPMNVWVDVIVHVRFRTDSTGLIQVWARQAGQSFTTSPNLTINGPTHKVLTGDGPTRTSADVDTANGVTGCYLEVGLYNGGTSWSDGSSGAHVHIMDELRRWATETEAKANWG